MRLHWWHQDSGTQAHKINTVSTSEAKLPLKLQTLLQEEERAHAPPETPASALHHHSWRPQLETHAKEDAAELVCQPRSAGAQRDMSPNGSFRSKTKEPGREEAFQGKHLRPAGLD